MRGSYDEIDGYITDVLQDLADELNSLHAAVQFDPKTISKNWFEAQYLPNWKGSQHSLLGIGIETLVAEAIVPSTTVERCQAYVFSHYKENTKDRAAVVAVSDLLRTVQSPTGFTAGGKGGYVFTMGLPTLSVEDFCNRQKLTLYFGKPLRLLLDWLMKNKQRFEK